MKGFFQGVATALPTPFLDGKIQFDNLEKLIFSQLVAQIDGLVVLGTTGEPSTLSTAEQDEIFSFAVKCAKGKTKLIFGVGNNDMRKAVERAIRAENLGADGLLAVTPYYNKCTQTGLIEYYKRLCNAVKIPVIAYSVPARTGVEILPSTLQKLCEIPNFAGLKDATGNILQTMEILRICREKRDIFVGDDALSLPLLSLGADGVISVVSNILPWDMKKLFGHISRGELTAARTLFYKMLPLINACFAEVNPIPIKYALSLLGYGKSETRLPLTTATDETKNKLFFAMKEYGIKV